MKSQDIVVLLKLISLQDQELDKGMDQLRSESIGGDPYSVRNLEALLGISKTEIAQSINRSIASGIARKESHWNEPRPHRRNLFDFIAKGIKFVFPAKVGAMQRGLSSASLSSSVVNSRTKLNPRLCGSAAKVASRAQNYLTFFYGLLNYELTLAFPGI